MKSEAYLKLLTVFLMCGLAALNTFAYVHAFVYNSRGQRDPFVPSYLDRRGENAKNEQAAKRTIDHGFIALQAVAYDPAGDSAVIINGKIMKTNDKTDFFVIKEILRDGVRLEVVGESIIFKLREND